MVLGEEDALFRDVKLNNDKIYYLQVLYTSINKENFQRKLF